jgi:hypothetical protein
VGGARDPRADRDLRPGRPAASQTRAPRQLHRSGVRVSVQRAAGGAQTLGGVAGRAVPSPPVLPAMPGFRGSEVPVTAQGASGGGEGFRRDFSSAREERGFARGQGMTAWAAQRLGTVRKGCGSPDGPWGLRPVASTFLICAVVCMRRRAGFHVPREGVGAVERIRYRCHAHRCRLSSLPCVVRKADRAHEAPVRRSGIGIRRQRFPRGRRCRGNGLSILVR